VPIRPFLDRDDAFGPEDIAPMSNAFEAALAKLGLVDRSDPATMALAKLIIEFAKVGERDPETAVRVGTAAIVKVKPPPGTLAALLCCPKRSLPLISPL
jgi:hypothetical protein